ncbi:MAG: OmpA family protein [bacterium]|nr:OmpA family protein [bacterium]
MPIRFLLFGWTILLLLFAACGGDAPSGEGASTSAPPEAPQPEGTAEGSGQAEAPEEPTDYLTFANGAVPLSASVVGPGKGASFEHAVRIVDGDPRHFGFVGQGGPEMGAEFVYALPALTRFSRFAVPGIVETPSPRQTFAKEVEVFGSSTGPDTGFQLLAKGALVTHAELGMVTEIPITSSEAVKWIKLRLTGGIQVLAEQMSFEFSELIGVGSQEPVELANHFTGIWKPRGAPIELKQDGPAVTGCYDGESELTGTVTGNILRATGINRAGNPSAFVLSVTPGGELRGVRSTQSGPFRLYTGPTAPPGTTTKCSEIPEPKIGCGSIVHGINFSYNSADIRADAGPVLALLFEGLQADADASIVIEGHTSSEGADDYNQSLSERRAQSVVEDLVRKGIDRGRIRAVGKGEAEPIAPNSDESGRSINRRVEVDCS